MPLVLAGTSCTFNLMVDAEEKMVG